MCAVEVKNKCGGGGGVQLKLCATPAPIVKATSPSLIVRLYLAYTNKKPSYCWESQPFVAIFRT